MDMHYMDYTILELLSQQRREELRDEIGQPSLEEMVGERRSGLRRGLAKILVRWGLRLDPSAAEREPAFGLARVRGPQS